MKFTPSAGVALTTVRLGDGSTTRSGSMCGTGKIAWLTVSRFPALLTHCKVATQPVRQIVSTGVGGTFVPRLSPTTLDELRALEDTSIITQVPRVHNHEHIRQTKLTTDPVKHQYFAPDGAEDTGSKKPRVEGEKRGEDDVLPGRRGGRRRGAGCQRRVTPSPRVATPAPRVAASSPRATPPCFLRVACGVEASRITSVSEGFQSRPPEVGFRSGPRIEGGNRNRVQINSGPDVNEQQIRCIPSLKTVHFNPPDWAS
jgi:hypothetical protein